MNKFKKAYIEITNICNLDCSFCPKNSRIKRLMSCAEFDVIAAQISQVTDYVYLHVMGEPLLHPELGRIISIAKEHGLYVNITTNGVLINNQLECLINNPVRKIAFSLHSYAGNELETPLEEYIINILNCVQKLKSTTICELRFWDNQKGNGGFSDNNLAILKIIESYFLLDYNLADSLIANSFKLCDNVYIGSEMQFEWPNIASSAAQKVDKYCYGLRTQIGVLVDGTVVPCCLDSEGAINLGNILDTPIKDILASQKATAIRKGFASRTATQQLCRNCKYAERF